MRRCADEFKDNAFFLKSADDETVRLVDQFELSSHTALLEIGCGPGRLPIGIISRFGEIGCYRGIDVDRRAIEWCRKHISRRHPSFRFDAIDARNDRYNPSGRLMDHRFRLPVADESFDLVYLHSVFSNMAENDVRVYAREFRRALKVRGRVFLTGFVEDDVPPVTINPSDYVMPCRGPLHVVRYERRFLLSIFEEAGLAVERVDHRGEYGGQTGVHLRRAR
jgi:SAM-dependent methyltransferase